MLQMEKSQNVVPPNAPSSPFACAEKASWGTITVVGVEWSFPANRIDWFFNPTDATPRPNPEWTWQLNRMSFWNDMAKAYGTTHDERFAEAFALQLGDWLKQTGGVPPETGYNDAGSPWRTIEEGLRLLGSWPAAYDAFAGSPAFTDELKARFVAAQRAQAHHLMAHRTGHNWLLIEMTGVYTFACRFPDFPESGELRRESASIFAQEIRNQVLPDGHHNELSPDYHSVFFVCAVRLYRIAKANGFESELPGDFLEILGRGAQAVLDMTTPSFVQPRFNDCFTIQAAPMLAAAAEFFPDRRDFLWGATCGREGEPPKGPTASRILPYAGFAAMRSGWDRDATFLAFDFGPLGMAHRHQDKLGFTLWKGGTELVFDDGGGQYECSEYRTYAVSGYDHNTLLVDGLAQNRSTPLKSDVPIDAGWETTPMRDRICGVYDDGYGPEQLKLARHKREIVFEKPCLFRLVDTAETLDGCAHDYELLFHVDSLDVAVAADRRSAHVRFEGKWELEIAVREGGEITTLEAVREPRLAGWYVGRNDKNLHPATTISVKAPGKRECHRFVTELAVIPAEGHSTFKTN